MKYLIVNFGGPRDLEEIDPFLTALLTDRDVIRTHFPPFFHNWFFRKVARKRALTLRKDYLAIGGKSPIYFDTEMIKELLQKRLQGEVFTFHRYLPQTHEKTLKTLKAAGAMTVLPLFPQFCYATTGSIARFLDVHLPKKLHWIKSYASHSAFIASYQRRIQRFFEEKNLKESRVTLLFSAHGVPKAFIDEGDPYQKECEASFQGVMRQFPQALGHLCYQSKFGKGEWLRPYTSEVCRDILQWNGERKEIVFVPISFTSDHIETLFEIEKLYLPLIQKQGLNAYRCPALNLEEDWVDALAKIAQSTMLHDTTSLIRP